MDLLTYLGAKKGKFTLPYKDDLLCYLLGKKASSLPEQTASGTTLEITAKKKNVLELTLDKMCSQVGTPTPDNPIDVIVADGYRNLIGLGTQLNGFRSTASGNFNTDTNSIGYYFDTSILPDTITFNGDNGNRANVSYYNNVPANGVASVDFSNSNSLPRTITVNKNYNYIHIQLSYNQVVSNIMINEGSTLLPYVPYGSNYINLVITNGVDTTNNLINLGNNFIGGIGDYKDKLTIDDVGNVSLVKNVGKVLLDGSETWYSMGWGSKFAARTSIDNAKLFGQNENANLKSNYFVSTSVGALYSQDEGYGIALRANTSEVVIRYDDAAIPSGLPTAFKTWLSTHNTDVYYILAEPTTVDLGTIDIELFKGANTITNSDNCNMVLKYY